MSWLSRIKRKTTCEISFITEFIYLHPFSFSFIIMQAFDQHLNMILGEVEEVVTSHEVDEETDEEIVKVW